MNKKPVETQHVVALYTQDHLTLREIAGKVGMTHAGVWKRLRAAGIEREAGTWVKGLCSFCGERTRHQRSVWRRGEKHYCRAACYYADLESHGYKPWRHGQRLARAIVSQYFQIPEGAIVHHKDGDNRNNDKANLAVYAGNGDHVRVHRTGKPVVALWDGASPRSLG